VLSKEFVLITVRFHEGINKSMRIRFRNNIYEIKKITNVKELDRFLQIIALRINI
jgi:head-tail adaptor